MAIYEPHDLTNDPRFAAEFLRNGCVVALSDATSDDAASLVIGWGPWHRSAVADAPTDSSTESKTRPSFFSLFTPDFYMTDLKPWRQPAHFQVVSRAFFNTHVLPKLWAEVNSQIHEPFQEVERRFDWIEPRFEGFEQQVKRIRQRFNDGRLVKAVPVVHAQACEIMTQDRLIATLKRMAAAPPSLIPQGFWDADSGEGLLGATPERLFALEATDKNHTLVTMALAGTRAKSPSENTAETLFNDPKERHEHQLVIDDLLVRLSAYGDVNVGETVTAELPTLFHLKTPISVAIREPQFDQLVRALHPTPALGIAPRSFGFENMREWDDVELRGRYGAPFGFKLQTHGRVIQDCLVAIRNVQWRGGRAPTLGSGCGFVEQSVTQREWAELQLKRDSVKKVLGV